MTEKEFTWQEEMDHFCKRIDWGKSFLDNQAIQFMNRGFDADKLIHQGEDSLLQRELNMECLLCGKSLNKEIIQKKIHIHLCEKCRQIVIERMQKKTLKFVEMQI